VYLRLLLLLYAEYITASYHILGVDATVTLERVIVPKSDVLHLNSPPLENGRYALAAAAHLGRGQNSRNLSGCIGWPLLRATATDMSEHATAACCMPREATAYHPVWWVLAIVPPSRRNCRNAYFLL
jgi:hypothetical protein